jgi:signal transduction histidine kinase
LAASPYRLIESGSSIQFFEGIVMQKRLSRGSIFGNLGYLKLLPVIALAACFDLDQIILAREINAAVINISGRQRMLSQRSALFALRLVCTQDSLEQEKLRQNMVAAIAWMERSHNGLIGGDAEMKLQGQPSREIQAIYFEAPFYLDRQIRDYIWQVRALVQAPTTELNQENPHLKSILLAVEKDLLEALEALVSQYQKESDEAQLEVELQQAQLYHESCAATSASQAHAQQLEKTLQELRRTQAQLIEIEKLSSIGQMVAGVAHEINNPVSFIYGNLRYASDYVQQLLDLLNLYQEYYGNPHPLVQNKIKAIDLDFLLIDLPKVLESMKIGAERVRQIVLSLRNFSRSDRVFMEAVDLHEGIDSTLLILQNRLKARYNRPGIEVVKDYGDLPLVECYAGQLNQVFMNLLSNAIDALEDTPARIGRITIRTSFNGDRSGVIIRIADNGPGMTSEVKAQLFDAFFTTKPIGKGTGLGLSISHQIVVEKHGGILKCESTPGKGTEFWIEIPLGIRASLSARESTPMAVTSH